LKSGGEVIHRKYILQKLTLEKRSHASGLARGIELTGKYVGSAVQIFIVRRLVDSHAPQHDRRVIAIPFNQRLQIF